MEHCPVGLKVREEAAQQHIAWMALDENDLGVGEQPMDQPHPRHMQRMLVNDQRFRLGYGLVGQFLEIGPAKRQKVVFAQRTKRSERRLLHLDGTHQRQFFHDMSVRYAHQQRVGQRRSGPRESGNENRGRRGGEARLSRRAEAAPGARGAFGERCASIGTELARARP